MNGYFYIDDITKQQCGPFTLNELETKRITPQTMIWHSGMSDWAAASTISELAYFFGGTPTTQAQTINTEKTQPQQEPQIRPSDYIQPQQNTNPQNGQYNNGQLQQNINPQNGQYNNRGQFDNRPFIKNSFNQTEVRPMPKNWLVESILVTIFCCWPFGIAGIVAANKVESLYLMGDYDAAEQASKNAKKWTLAGFFAIIGLIALYIIFMLIVGVSASFF